MLSDLVLENDVDRDGIVHLGRIPDYSFFYDAKLHETTIKLADEDLDKHPYSTAQPFDSKDARTFLKYGPELDVFKLIDAYKDHGTNAMFLEVLPHHVEQPLSRYIELLSTFKQAKKYFNKGIENFTTIHALEFVITNGIGFHEDDLFTEALGGNSKYNVFVCILNDYNYKFVTSKAEFIPRRGDVYLFNHNIEHAVIPTQNIALDGLADTMLHFLAYTEIFNRKE